MENPVFADNFFDNPEIFADNPARGRGRGHHGGRKSKSATTSAKRRAAARKAAATRKRNRRGGATRRSSGANVRIRIRDNPEFYDNPEFFENPQIDWMSIGLGVGFAAGSYVLIDLLDRYIATMGKTAPWYGPDAAARILERPSGTRIAVQALVGLAGIGGAWYFGNRGSQKASAILAGIGGGALTHLTVQLLTTWAMPSLLKATTGETTDTSLGNRLYPEYQAGSQAKLKAWTDAENTTGVSDSQIAMNFPWIKGGTVAGIDQEQTGVGAVTRQLSAPQPSMWPASYREPVASRPYQPTAAYAAGVAGVASADGSVGGCSSCGKSTRRMPPQSGPGVQGWNGLTAGPGGGMGNWPYPPAGGGCGCQNCQAAALNADALALAAGGGYVGDINAMHRGGWTGGGWPNSMWDVGHGDHCGCQVCAQKRSQLRVAPAARQTTGPGPCVSVETMSSPRAIHEVRMPDVEQHVQPAAPPPVRVKQGCVKVVVHETPEAAVEMAACDAAESAQVYGSPNYGSPPPMAAPIATAAAMAANQAASNAAAAAAVADAAAANASRPTIARMGTAGIPTGPSMRDLMARPQDRSLKGARNRQANLARGTRKQRTSQ